MTNIVELQSWWKQLDLTWKRIFKRALDINHNPTESELFEILNLEEIDCSNSQIISLDPLKHFYKLRKLNCSNTNISLLDKIGNLILIDELDISRTYVKSLKPISRFNQLWRLKCDQTNLLNLNGVEELTSLEYINCSDTNIKNIDELFDLPSLKLIECNNLDLNLLYPNGIKNLENKIRLDGIDFIFNQPTLIDINEKDALFEESARLVVMYQQGSTSLIQRKLKLGYNRAGRIIDQLEAYGILGPFEGSKSREVLIKDEFQLAQHLNSIFKDRVKDYIPFLATDSSLLRTSKKLTVKKNIGNPIKPTLSDENKSIKINNNKNNEEYKDNWKNIIKTVFIIIITLFLILFIKYFNTN